MPTTVLYWNTDTGLVSTQRFNGAAAQIQARRGEADLQVILLGTVGGVPNTPLLLDASISVGIVIRDPANLKSGCLAGPNVLTIGTSAAAGYTGSTSTDTTLTQTVMHVGSADATPESASYVARAALYYVPTAGGEEIESLAFSWTILANYYRPTQPAADVIATYPLPSSLPTIVTVTALTGSSSALDHIATATLSTGQVLLVSLTGGGALGFWRLELDSDPLNGATSVTPTDHDASTNPRSLRQRL